MGYVDNFHKRSQCCFNFNGWNLSSNSLIYRPNNPPVLVPVLYYNTVFEWVRVDVADCTRGMRFRKIMSASFSKVGGSGNRGGAVRPTWKAPWTDPGASLLRAYTESVGS